VAAAEAPAKPVPTTTMSICLLFAGLTKLMCPLWFDHFCSIGPPGILSSNFICGDFLEVAEKYVQRNGGKQCRNQVGIAQAQFLDYWGVARMVYSQSLESTLKSVAQVKGQHKHKENGVHFNAPIAALLEIQEGKIDRDYLKRVK
jgi:hypothetical protein